MSKVKMFGTKEMADVRRSDKAPKKWFRSSRFFKQEGKWYFYTREGTMEGPHSNLERAEERLQEYIRVMNSGFMPRDSKLHLEPLLDPRRH